MPTKGDTQINNFVGGLITEASPLTFPPNASIDEVNFKLKRDGTRERRLGIDYEDNYTLHNTGLTADQLAASRQTFFNWPTPSGNVDVDIGIIQVAGLLFFVDMNTANPSANLLNQSNSIDLGIPTDAKLSYTIINNEVAVVSASLDDPFFLSYNADTDVVTATTETIKIRDIYGVDDSLGDNERPTTLSAAHEYNLRNQGWNSKIVTVSGAEVLADTFNTLGEYPSNSDTWSLGKIADVSDADVDKYDPNTLNKNSFDLGRAAKGHFVIDLYDRGTSRSTLSGITIPNGDRELGRPSAVESYAGRLFYSGITSKVVGGDKRSPNLSGAVLYSQVGKSNEDLSRCYQEADPTSPTNNDAIDTDGGVIQISGAVDIVMLKTIKTSLFVFASNGIWQIRGDDEGFRSTSFQVNKISSIGVFSPESIVEANGTIFFWAKSGIYSLTPNQVDSTTFDSTNVTITTIQRGYNSLPDLVKQNVKGYYDLDENKVRWLFRSDVPETLVVPDPDAPVIEVGTPSVGASSRKEPEVVRVNSTLALILYTDSTSQIIYYQTASINPSTLAVTLGTETTLVDTGLAAAVNGYTVERLSDNRIVAITTENLVTRARLITFSAGVPTVGSPTTINTVFAPISQTAQLRSAPIDTENIIVRSRNLTNGVGSMQVVNVSGSTITFGSVVSTSSQNHVNTKVAMLTPTIGIYVDQISSGTSYFTSWFSVSGTTITLKTEDTLPDLADFPSGTTSRQVLFGDVQANGTSTATVISSGVISDASVTNEDAIITSTLTISGNDVIVGDVVYDLTPTLSETTMYVSSIKTSGGLWVVYMDESTTPRKMYLSKYAVGVNTQSIQLEMDTDTLFERHPEVIDMTNDVALIAYRTVTDVDAIKAVAARID